MQKGFRWLATSVALVAASFSPLLHATVIAFESPLLTGLYFPGDSFTESGFQMTQGFDAGIVDTAQALGNVAPTNNTTQFYTNVNDGDLTFTTLSGLAFSLNGFSAAFVPLEGSVAPAQTIGIVALATTMTGAQFGTIFGLGDTSSTSHGSPFLTFSGAANFASFTNLKSVDFFTCAIVNGSACTVPTQNNGQFALDNVNVTAVPEPETLALMSLGLLAIAAVRRRRAR
jgi:hypothetical protein